MSPDSELLFRTEVAAHPVAVVTNTSFILEYRLANLNTTWTLTEFLLCLSYFVHFRGRLEGLMSLVWEPSTGVGAKVVPGLRVPESHKVSVVLLKFFSHANAVICR